MTTVQQLIEDLVQLVGWSMLKLITAGKYEHDASNRLAEGAVGLVTVAGACALVLLW